ncbi:Uncharacterized protein Rs2_50582 [Raphanus sativus]|nr:Uncharacterized protein Rs2_51274 [Raphanus sativus]KAJ4867874.1 Uncharacterized protein Rs2_50582 [Raphanus sativus]
MPPGAKKRKAAKKKQQQQQEASSTQTNLIPTNHDSSEEDSVRSTDKDSDERIEIADSSRDHDKNSTSSSSSSSSSDDESSEVKKKKKKESGESVSEAITANVIVESIGLMDSATPSDPNTEKVIEIATVGTVVSAENEESSLPKPNEITAEVSLASDEVKQASSSATTAVKKETEGKASSLAPEVSKESDATTSSHEEEGSVGPTHGDPVDKLRNRVFFMNLEATEVLSQLRILGFLISRFSSLLLCTIPCLLSFFLFSQVVRLLLAN